VKEHLTVNHAERFQFVSAEVLDYMMGKLVAEWVKQTGEQPPDNALVTLRIEGYAPRP